MVKFCTKCGSPLDANGKCTICVADSSKPNVFKSFINSMKKRMGIGWDGEDATNPFERNMRIVPDVVTAESEEIPVKQYNIALLRSRILQKYAEGRLQITNKRIIFRAAGMSVSDRTVVQREFRIDEIAGVEIKKSNRISVLSLFLALYLAFMIWLPTEELVASWVKSLPGAAMICGYAISAALALPFFLLKRKFWLKLVGTSAAVGVMSGLADLSISGLLLGETILSAHNILLFVFLLIWIFNMILVAFVPDLTFCIKTNSTGDAIQIRRKVWGVGIKPTEENTGFSEVLPWADTEFATREICALINDLQTFGDTAIEKWKE